jgi:hypothetical protein
LQGDITSPEKIEEVYIVDSSKLMFIKIVKCCDGKPVDLVLSDGAPDGFFTNKIFRSFFFFSFY